ncbi:MAG: hypothetical protein IJ689_04775 [Alphaproteobacteria bacterium]|nr:hypothetical protein [Alphaproteobacteria bacterium]
MYDKIDYEELIAKALKGVVRQALEIVENQGLPGDHHFYIAFRTDHPEVKMGEALKKQYPKEITIVLQNQFEKLQVFDDCFSVVLRFNHEPQTLVVPFEALTYFGDPSVRFGLSFGGEREIAKKPEKPAASAEIISIDSFRKKNA